MSETFTQKLDAEQMKVFEDANSKPYPQQCVFFLNAFWAEVGDQAEWIYSVFNTLFRQADMTAKGVQYIHQYQEGVDLDLDLALYYYEQVCRFADDPEHESMRTNGLSAWAKEHPNFKEEYGKSIPEMKTSIVRKKEFKEKVDVNFDGRVSMLESLLHIYEVSPELLIQRSQSSGEEHEEIRKARLALEEVNRAIAAYEAEKHRLTELSESGSGVKALKAKNELAQLNAGPLWEQLNKSLITAEAAVRIACRKYGGVAGESGAAGDNGGGNVQGALWWMQRDLEEKQKKYGKVKK